MNRSRRSTSLADLGVRIAIDDFGTGYSNMTYLRRLPVSELKLAASFIDELRPRGRGRDTAAQIVESIVSLAHTLGLTVTAEGVETAAQADALREIGCDTAQGTSSGRPAPPDAIQRLFDAAPGAHGGGLRSAAAAGPVWNGSANATVRPARRCVGTAVSRRANRAIGASAGSTLGLPTGGRGLVGDLRGPMRVAMQDHLEFCVGPDSSTPVLQKCSVFTLNPVNVTRLVQYVYSLSHCPKTACPMRAHRGGTSGRPRA